jgi:hypothetical protein
VWGQKEGSKDCIVGILCILVEVLDVADDCCYRAVLLLGGMVGNHGIAFSILLITKLD